MVFENLRSILDHRPPKPTNLLEAKEFDLQLGASNFRQLEHLYGIGPLHVADDSGVMKLPKNGDHVLSRKLSNYELNYVNNKIPVFVLVCEKSSEFRNINANNLSIRKVRNTRDNFGDFTDLELLSIKPNTGNICLEDILDPGQKISYNSFCNKVWSFILFNDNGDFFTTWRTAEQIQLNFTDGLFYRQILISKPEIGELIADELDGRFTISERTLELKKAAIWNMCLGAKRNLKFEKPSKDRLLLEFFACSILESSFIGAVEYEVEEEDEAFNPHTEKTLRFLEYCKQHSSVKFNDFLKKVYESGLSILDDPDGLRDYSSTSDEDNVFKELFEIETDQDFITKILELVQDTIKVQREDFTGIPEQIFRFLNELILLRFCTQASQVPFICSASQSIRYMTLEPKNFTHAELKHLWEGFKDLPLIDLHGWSLDNEILISHERAFVTSGSWDTNPQGCFKNIESEVSINELERSVIDLFDECVSNKYWTIPPDAYCDLQVGEFEGIFLNEISGKVFFKLVYRTSYVLCGFVKPEDHEFWFSPAINFEHGQDIKKLKLTLLLVIVSIIRDFWVLEQREKSFETIRKRLPRGRKTKGRRDRVIYLPRAQYINKLSSKKLYSELQLDKRRAHFVRGHARHIKGAASNKAYLLAERYGIDLKINQTFVKPHERGDKALRAVFRSRSASSILSTKLRTIKRKRNLWFKFEADVAAWFARAGFEVEHVGKSGDDGIDVIATIEVDSEVETWIAQCKAYSDLVQPSAIRELIGVREIHGGNAKLLLATTGRISEKTSILAREQSVEVIQAIDFENGILPTNFWEP